MRLLRTHIIAAETCGGLLDGLDIWFRSPSSESDTFDPLCLIGPNGAGKSQLLQVLAEIFQSVFHACVPTEERVASNTELQFEVEYLIQPEETDRSVHIRVARQAEGKRKTTLTVQKKDDGEWVNCKLDDPATLALFPRKVIGYTSGGNETLSLPFLVSRSGYADEVSRCALSEDTVARPIPDTRLMLIDYGTHLEVLVSNLLLGTETQCAALLQGARLSDLHSFRCIIQLNHSAVKRTSPHRTSGIPRKGVQLTQELESYLDNLKRCATCYHYDVQTETYIFDFLVNEETKIAFQFFWENTLNLYSSFHKLAMLNDLAIPKPTRERFKKAAKTRRFASRLPEPQDEQKIFRFERVTFVSQTDGQVVDYVALSDGEHQLAQLLGTLGMVSFANVLFLLDEPESHFNPQWRVKFISKILELPTNNGIRKSNSMVTKQDCLLTTHSPFVPSDMKRENVFIFSKDESNGKVRVRRPEIETYGTTFDAILEECFGVKPPISEVSHQEIKDLMKSNDANVIRAGMERLGHSVEKVFLADRLRQLAKNEEA